MDYLRVASWSFVNYRLACRCCLSGGRFGLCFHGRISRLTWIGKVAEAVITPDGNYAIYVVSGPHGQSLWIRQVAASAALEIIPAQPHPYTHSPFRRMALTFTSQPTTKTV